MESRSSNILVVDDEQTITDQICEVLGMLGYRARAAYDGLQALQEVEKERPDLILLDVMMPRIDGLQVLQSLRGNAATQDIPVIMLTAMGSNGDIVEGIKSGATMYLTKPVEIAKIAALIAAILGPRQSTGRVGNE